MSGVSDEQRAEWRADARSQAADAFLADDCREDSDRILALLDEVDTLRERLAEYGAWIEEHSLLKSLARAELAETALRDMEIERNMLRITVKELTDSLEAGDACGAVGCRAMERLAKVEALTDELDKSLTGKFIARELRAALSTERGETK